MSDVDDVKEGPTKLGILTCFGCKYFNAIWYECIHPNVTEVTIFVSGTTPNWCPYLKGELFV